MEMTRRERILKLIVDHFIKTAQPVGSHTLIEEYGLSCSSATIRNEMQALENEGYLEKTHTSSGRVPSSKGYRYYIDHLRNQAVDEDLKYQLQTILQEKAKSIEDIIRESCEVLTHMTNLASVVLGPNAEEEHLVSIQLVPISDKTATAIFITDKGYVENKTFVFPTSLKTSDIEKCVVLLNDRLKGTEIAKLLDKMETLRPLLSDYVKEHDIIYQAIAQAMLRFARDRVTLYGQEHLFDQPEFASDAEKLRKMISFLDDPRNLQNFAFDEDDDIAIHIGDGSDDLDGVSVIKTNIRFPGRGDGSIALVGPKRMDYERVVSALEYVANELRNYFKEESEEEDARRNKDRRKEE